MSFPEPHWQLCFLQAVPDALNKARKKDRGSLGYALRQIYFGGEERGSRGSLTEYVEVLGWNVSQEPGVERDLGLFPLWAFWASQRCPSAPVPQEPIGTVEQRGEEGEKVMERFYGKQP